MLLSLSLLLLLLLVFHWVVVASVWHFWAPPFVVNGRREGQRKPPVKKKFIHFALNWIPFQQPSVRNKKRRCCHQLWQFQLKGISTSRSSWKFIKFCYKTEFKKSGLDTQSSVPVSMEKVWHLPLPTADTSWPHPRYTSTNLRDNLLVALLLKSL